MQLHIARLCLDCEEIHTEQSCPACGSEAFAYLTRWVPAAERRTRQRSPVASESNPAITRGIPGQFATSPPSPTRGRRMLKRGAIGVAAVAAGWLWRWSSGAARSPDSERSETTTD